MSRPTTALLVAVALLLGACGASEPEAAIERTTSSSTGSIASADSATSTTAAGPSPDEAASPTTARRPSTTGSEPEPDPDAAPTADAPLPTDGAAMADALTLAEGAIRDPAVSDEDAAAWGRHQQRLYLHLARNPTWV